MTARHLMPGSFLVLYNDKHMIGGKMKNRRMVVSMRLLLHDK